MDGYLSFEDFHRVRRIIGSAIGDIQLLDIVSALQVAAAMQLQAALVSLLSVMVVPITISHMTGAQVSQLLGVVPVLQAVQAMVQQVMAMDSIIQQYFMHLK